MKTHDLEALHRALPALKATTGFASTKFTKLAPFAHGGLFLGRFIGRAPWERHRHGDELVYVLEGELEFTLMTARGPEQTLLRAGGMCVVPRGAWHRSHARTAVTLLSATPTPTDISFAPDPRTRRRPKRTAAKRARSRKV